MGSMISRWIDLATLTSERASPTAAADSTMADTASAPIVAAALEELVAGACSDASTGARSGERRCAAALLASCMFKGIDVH